MNITNEQTTLFFQRFCVGRMDAYGTYYKDSFRYNVIREPVTMDVVRKHLEGIQPIGIYPVKKNLVRFAAVDFDRQDSKPVVAIIKHLTDLGLPCYMERSKGKGFHVWLFFKTDVLAEKAIRLLQILLVLVDAGNVEIFPRQSEILEGLGSFINLPLAGHLIGQGKTLFLDQNFHPYQDQWQFLTAIQTVTEQNLDDALLHLPEPQIPSSVTQRQEELRRNSTTNLLSRTHGLLPCKVKMLADGVVAYQRLAAFYLAMALRDAGLSRRSILIVLNDWRLRNHPEDSKQQITPDEVREQIFWAFRRDYSGQGCFNPAIAPFCDDACPVKRKLTPEPNPAIDQYPGGIQ